MTLLQTIKADSLQARKNKSADASFLITLLSEASRPGFDNGKRESTDEEVLRVIKKFTDGAKDLLAAVEKLDDQEKIAVCKMELEILKKYTPAQLTEVELKKIIDSLLVSTPNATMGLIMGSLKKVYGGQYDAALASKIVKELL